MQLTSDNTIETKSFRNLIRFKYSSISLLRLPTRPFGSSPLIKQVRCCLKHTHAFNQCRCAAVSARATSVASPSPSSTPEHQRWPFFALSSAETLLSTTPPTMFVAASEDLDDLFDIVQRAGARAAEKSQSDSDEGNCKSMVTEDTDSDLIPTTVLETVQPKKERRGKVSKVRMNHCFRVKLLIKPTRRHNDSCKYVCRCVIHI